MKESSGESLSQRGKSDEWLATRRDLLKFGAAIIGVNVLSTAFPSIRDALKQIDLQKELDGAERRKAMIEKAQDFLREEYERFVQEKAADFRSDNFDLRNSFLFVKDISESPLRIKIEIMKFDPGTPPGTLSETVAGFIMEIKKSETYDYQRDLQKPLLHELGKFLPQV